MDVKVFDGEKIKPGDLVAYPSRTPGGAIMRRARVKEIREWLTYRGEVRHSVRVQPDRLHGEYRHEGVVALRNLKTVVKL